MPLHTYEQPTTIAQLDGPPSASRMTTDAIRLHDPDVHLALETPSRTARCSLWWTETPDYENETVGLIGHYGAASTDAAQSLLREARARLREAGCTLAVGPMDGATWFTYRFVTDGTGHPPFFLEPTHPSSYPDHFRADSFQPLAEYVSAYVPDVNTEGPGEPPIDVSVRPLNPDHVDTELSRLYRLVVDSFADNFLYTPIAEGRFVPLYRGLLPAIDPSLVRLAERPDGRLAGVAFLVPNRATSANGSTVDSVIAKTLAVHPDLAGNGLGSWLLAEAQWTARQHGYPQAIHALMHETNRSRRISDHYGDVIRRYTLFAQSL